MNLADAQSLVYDLKARANAAGARAWFPTNSEQEAVRAFHLLADSWLGLAREVSSNPSATYADGGSKEKVMLEIAPRLVSHAQGLEAIFEDAGFLAASQRFATEFPAALRDATTGFIGGLGDVVGNVVDEVGDAAMGLAGPAFVIGLGAIALLFLFTRAGGQFSLPFLKAG